MKLLFSPDVWWISASSSGECVGRLPGARAREDRRKLRNEVFPELRAPITRILMFGLGNCVTSRAGSTYLYGVGSLRLLTRLGLLIVLTALLA